MADLAGDAGPAPAARLAALAARHPILWTWLAVSAVLAACWLVGISPNSDLDDGMKLLGIRQFLETGDWFERTVPGIVQPEPFVSHWLRILDLPYALVAWPLAPLLGPKALAIAAFAIPLLLLLATLALFWRIVGAFGFQRTEVAFILALILTGRTLFECAPGRVDYHNVQIVLLLLCVVLSFDRRPAAAVANGAAVALALASSLEFAPFFALVMAAHALWFVRAEYGAGRRLRGFGLGLVAGAAAVYVVSEPAARYGAAACDVYSAPHAIALGLAGLTFAAASALSASGSNQLARGLAIAIPAAATILLLAWLYPQCLAGPYGAMSPYVVDNWLRQIPQERSLLGRPDFVLSMSIVSAGIMFAGVLATLSHAASRGLRDPMVALFAALALVALVLACAYTRYLRYLPLFAAPGILIALAALSPGLRRPGAWLARPVGERLPSALLPVLGGSMLAAAFVLSVLARPAETAPAPGAALAGGCGLDDMVAYRWPAGARIMAPPDVGMVLLASGGGASVVAVPFHTAAAGIERAYRFLDPATEAPRTYLESARATHVAVCAWPEPVPQALSSRYGFVMGLMAGTPPSWLEECPAEGASPLRLYRYPAGGGAACPVPLAGDGG